MSLTAFNIDFCDSFGYPDQVRGHFRKILGCINTEKVSSVILTGSTSRGELTYALRDGNLNIFSDYELLIISNGRVDKDDLARLLEEFKGLEEEFSNGNPLFHIDCTYVSQRKLANFGTNIRTWEIRSTGALLYGRDMREEAPRVSVDNLDFKDLNEVLIWRLWAMTLYFPKSLLTTGDVNTDQGELYKYVICRNILDLTTFLLPSCGSLLPTFKQRVEHVSQNYTSSKFNPFFDKDLPSFLNECLDGKLHLAFNKPVVELHSKAVRCFRQAGRYLLHNYGIPTDNDEAEFKELETYSYRLFNNHSLRRQIYEGMLMTHKLRCSDFSGSLRWFFAKKLGIILRFLYHMQIALVHYLDGEIEEANDSLNDGADVIQRFSLEALDKNAIGNNGVSFPDRWLYLRRVFASLLVTYFRALKDKTAYLEKEINT